MTFVSKMCILVAWTYVISDLNCEETVEKFYEKNLQKTNQTQFRIKKVVKRKGDKLYVKWKDYDIYFNSWINKKILLYKMSYFPEPYTRSKSKIKVEFDLPNDATKSGLKNATGADTLKFAEKANLASIKSDIEKLDIVN